MVAICIQENISGYIICCSYFKNYNVVISFATIDISIVIRGAGSCYNKISVWHLYGFTRNIISITTNIFLPKQFTIIIYANGPDISAPGNIIMVVCSISIV